MKRLFLPLLVMAVMGTANAQNNSANALSPEQKKEKREEKKQDWEKLKTDLALDADQESKMKNANKEMAESLKNLRDNQALSKEEKMAQMKSIRESHQAKLNSFLTASQMEKYKIYQREQMQERRRQRKNS